MTKPDLRMEGGLLTLVCLDPWESLERRESSVIVGRRARCSSCLVILSMNVHWWI